MTIVLRPIGRGNWKPWLWQLEPHIHMASLLVKVGDRLEFAGLVWRIVEVRT